MMRAQRTLTLLLLILQASVVVHAEEDPDVGTISEATEQITSALQFSIGVMHAHGKGVEQDHAVAATWFRKAAEQGLAAAQFQLGWLYNNGQGVEQDYQEAAKWYRKAAEQGNANAQFNLAVIYSLGMGTNSPISLRYLYLLGLGITQDYQEATYWYRKAAEQGFAGAQNNLGWMYENGRGVEQDNRKAASWYLKAAEGGNYKAQRKIARMYVEGTVVEQSNLHAYMWFHIASLHGDDEAVDRGSVLEGTGVIRSIVQNIMQTRAQVRLHIASLLGRGSASDRLADIEEEMTPEEIEEAQSRAKACIANDYKGC